MNKRYLLELQDDEKECMELLKSMTREEQVQIKGIMIGMKLSRENAETQSA